ncbi:MAG: oligosaccharide flippase family protein, partial [Bacilli bacterium]
MRNNSLLKGAIWGTLAVFLSKVLGFIYLLPFNRYLDVNDKLVFSSSIRIYAYILLVATAGIPFATASMIAKYNSQKNYQVGFKLLRSNILMMFIFGLVAASILFMAATPL